MSFFELHFEVEKNCILKCSHCSSFANRNGQVRGYSLEDIVNMISMLEVEGEIFFTGGEPLIQPELLSTINRINELPNQLVQGLFTTGLIYERGKIVPVSSTYAKALYNAGIRKAYVSIYSSEPQIHDNLTNFNGAFKLTQKAIDNMIRAGIDIKINCVVFRDNYSHLDEIFRMALASGISEVRLLKLIEHGNASANWVNIGITEMEYESAVSNILEKKPKIKITAAGIPDRLPCRPLEDAVGCDAGNRLLYVRYDGDVFPCASVKNNTQFRICHISEIDKVKQFAKENAYSNFEKCLCKG